MARRRRPTATPFDLPESRLRGEWPTFAALASWISQEIDLALGVRATALADVELAWSYYEQSRMRARTAPWPDAADLPSPYAPEYTDAVHARLVQTIFAEPVWTVEGWGPSARRAPLVEEFHQRALEDERFQVYADEWILRGLVEGVGTLEVREAVEVRRERTTRRVALARDPETGQPVLGEDGQPVYARDPETGDLVDATDDREPSAEVETDVAVPVRIGPAYDVIPYADFLVLPAHARSRQQVWGYAKRFWRRVPELRARAAEGIYDAAAVEALGTDDEAATVTAVQAPAGPTPVTQQGMTAQKELWELQLLADLDGEGERWWRVTVHKDRRVLLRLQHDDRTTRYIRWMPFPKPGSVDRGYSLITHKLITVLEEDTARRNMTADRMALKVGTPILRQQGALWDPYEQPFGPKAVIDVRSMQEIQPLQGIEDVPTSVMAWRGAIRDDADRLIGQNDVALGQISQEKRTLGEVQLVAGYAEVRMQVLMKRLAEPLEELFQARHTIWVRTLRAHPSRTPQRALIIGETATGIDTHGVAHDGTITADLLDGIFWGKPRGSVETADLGRQRQDWLGFLQALPALIALNPAIRLIVSTVPAARALLEHTLRVHRVPHRQAFLGSPAKDVFEILDEQQALARDPRMAVLLAAAGGSARAPGGALAGVPGEVPGGVPGGPAEGGAPAPTQESLAPAPAGMEAS